MDAYSLNYVLMSLPFKWLGRWKLVYKQEFFFKIVFNILSWLAKLIADIYIAYFVLLFHQVEVISSMTSHLHERIYVVGVNFRFCLGHDSEWLTMQFYRKFVVRDLRAHFTHSLAIIVHSVMAFSSRGSTCRRGLKQIHNKDWRVFGIAENLTTATWPQTRVGV